MIGHLGQLIGHYGYLIDAHHRGGVRRARPPVPRGAVRDRHRLQRERGHDRVPRGPPGRRFFRAARAQGASCGPGTYARVFRPAWRQRDRRGAVHSVRAHADLADGGPVHDEPDALQRLQQHPPAFGHGLARGAVVVTLGLAILTTVLVAGGYLVEESDAAWRTEGTIWHRALMSPPLRWLAGHSPRARAFLFRRFTPGHYLGLNLTMGLGLSFVSLVIFGAVAKTLLARDAIPQFDVELAAALRETATPAADAVWTAVSRLGTFTVMLVPGVALAMLLAIRRWWLLLGGLLAAGVGATLLEVGVRHFMVHPDTLGDFSAPSGQALGAMVFYGMLGYFVVLLTRNRRLAPFVVAACLLLVASICFGRLYLGTRYFSDVVGGLAAGGVWLCACITGLEVARRRATRERTTDRDTGPDRR
jgi:membrane-associated phospholipid phosphatase